MLGLVIAAIFTVIVVRLMLSNVKIEPVLFLCGIGMMLIAEALGLGKVFKVGQGTGLAFFDAFDYVRTYMASNFSGLGLTIMAVLGYVKYCDQIGANQRLVKMVTDPLLKLKSPYFMLFFGMIIAMALSLFIASATGLTAMVMATIFPILMSVGVSRVSSATVGCLSDALPLTIGLGPTILAAKVCKEELTTFWATKYLPVGVIAIIITALIQTITQKYFDKKENLLTDLKKIVDKETEQLQGPVWYALLPILPCVMLLVFSNYVISGIKMDVITAFFSSTIIALLCETIYTRKIKESFEGFTAFLDGMGYALSVVCILIVACGTFAYGLQTLGAIDILLNAAKSVGISSTIMVILFTLAIFGITIVMGSGNAAFYAFAAIGASTAEAMGMNIAVMIIPMLYASNQARSLSPVAGIMIATTGMSGLKSFEIIKRCVIPVLVSLVTVIAIPLIFDALGMWK